ncbi:putative transposase [Burkholderia paludis]|uniref:Putative transposase n=1 Tax=Burkholderia paludis TaxID=1506587 RepID=A0A6J5D7M8_9BURK|nr:hypothetical protein LMG30113_00763 [Burkholderia paludis]VWB96407.1 putative transposase [Burkholderia paludis]
MNVAERGQIDKRTTRHLLSPRKRKCIEPCFGWGKTIGPLRQVMVRGLEKVDPLLTLTMAAYNLTRLRSLAAVAPAKRLRYPRGHREAHDLDPFAWKSVE